jgi:hypothetical protein
MMRILGGIFVGLLLAGAIAGVVVPLVPPSARQPWIVWLIAGVSVAASVYVTLRTRKTPPE